MQQYLTVVFGLAFLLLTSCQQSQIKTPDDAMGKIDDFKIKVKFLPEKFYPGIADPEMRPILTIKINQVADDFAILAKSGNASEKDYQDKIKIGLERFADVYVNIDTEDRERICFYFEELMDIVGLESSDGLLNEFMYGFDPTKNDPGK